MGPRGCLRTCRGGTSERVCGAQRLLTVFRREPFPHGTVVRDERLRVAYLKSRPPEAGADSIQPQVVFQRLGAPADVAAGGQGAPLVPYFDWFVFGGRPVALLNVGGIANFTFVGRTLGETTGFDTGPGNALIDEAMRRAFGREYDAGGRVAASGRIDLRMLRRLDHPYFRRPPPKSTGRELFGPAFLEDRLGGELRRRPADVVATLTVFTARTIADAFARFAPRPVQEVVVSGGGAFNRTLLRHLEWMLWPAAVRPIDVYGFPPLAREPAAFALLAAQTLRGRPSNVPAATGARRPVVLGKIVPAGLRGRHAVVF